MTAPHSQGAAHVAAMADWLKQTHRVIESQIHGPSMGSTLPDGARIRIQCASGASYHPGDIVVFMLGTRLIAHRAMACGRSWRAGAVLITRGDGMLLPDPPIPVEAVLGVVTAVWDAMTWRAPGGAPEHSLWWRLPAALALVGTRVALAGSVPVAQRLVMRLRWGSVLLGRCRAWLRSHLS